MHLELKRKQNVRGSSEIIDSAANTTLPAGEDRDPRIAAGLAEVFAHRLMMIFFFLAETKISPKLYTPWVLPTIRGCLEGLALMV